MRSFLQDVRYAVRLFSREPGTTAVAILTLALGIGANTALFSAVDAILLRSLPYDEPDQLMMVWEKRPAEGVFDHVVAPADFNDWAAMQSVFAAIAAQATAPADLTGVGEPVRLTTGSVSPAFFDVFRVRPQLGRLFRPEEAVEGQHRVIVLGHRAWQSRFGSDETVIGRVVSLNGSPYEIIGVLPPTFEFPDSTIEVWTPLALAGTAQPPSRVLHALHVYARLEPHVSLSQARADMDRIGAVLQKQYPESNRNHGAHVVPLQEELARPVQKGLLLLFAGVGFVLLIACVNVANLLLAKTASRRREMAVRAALGASRGRIVAQALTESLVLGLLGGGAALLVAVWGIEALRGLVPQGVPLVGIDRLGLEVRVLGFTLAISLATAVLFGLLPAWQLAGQDANDTLKEGGRTAGGVRRRLRATLVVSEIALASLLLVATGLTLRSFNALLHADAGFDTDGRLTAFVSLRNARYTDNERRAQAFAEIEERFAKVPGIKAVGAVNDLPLSGPGSRGGIAIDGRDPVPDSPTRAHLRTVTPGYFRAMGLALRSGRVFSAADDARSPLVAIVNETFARTYLSGASPLGRRVRLVGGEAWREIVGIVHDVRHWGLDSEVRPELYMPHTQLPLWSGLYFVLASDNDAASYTAAIREQLRSVDADLPLSNVRTMEQVAASSVAPRRSAMIVLAIFGAFALVLSGAGIYGVMAHLVALRRSEIGVRMTLGARPSDIMRLILRDSALQTIVGLTLGLAGGVLVMRVFRAVLYQVSPADPLTLFVVAATLTLAALAASFVPARRAMRVNPVQALRE